MAGSDSLQTIRYTLVILTSLSILAALSITSEIAFQLGGMFSGPISTIPALGVFVGTITLVYFYYRQTELIERQADISRFPESGEPDIVLELEDSDSSIVLEIKDEKSRTELERVIQDYEIAEIVEGEKGSDSLELVLRKFGRREEN